ncbi:hypothetical protein Tco_0668110 [Tanacetum coccineum]
MQSMEVECKSLLDKSLRSHPKKMGRSDVVKNLLEQMRRSSILEKAKEETKAREDAEKDELKRIFFRSKTFMYYQVFRGDGSSKNYKILSEILEDFDRLDVEELYRISQE